MNDLLPSSKTRLFPNKYKGVCRICGGTVAAYAGFCWATDQGWKTGHESCVSPEAAKEALNAQAAKDKLEADRLAVIQSKADYKFDLNQRLGLSKVPCEPGKLQQMAYNDIWTATYKYAGNLTETEIRFALNNKTRYSETKVIGIDVINKRVALETNTYVPD